MTSFNTEAANDAGLYGQNAWLAEEMYERFRSDPTSVDDTWRQFFAHHNGLPTPTATTNGTAPAGQPNTAPTGQPNTAQTGQPNTAQTGQPNTAQSGQPNTAPTAQPNTAPTAQPNTAASNGQAGGAARPGSTPGEWSNAAPTAQSHVPLTNGTNGTAASVVSPTPDAAAPPNANGTAPSTASANGSTAAPSAPSTDEVDDTRSPLRGAAARIVSNMESSLEVPTATSFREIPAKLLDVNRMIINGYLRRTRGGKLSYTHLIAWATVRAIADSVPAMNASFVTDDDGKPFVITHPHVGLGIAVDVEKSDGSRALLVPCIKNADTMTFREFVDEYEGLVEKARTGKLSIDDFSGTTVSITNPGTIGTVQSVPRLMKGQGLIVGVGSIAYPTEYQAADPRTLADLAVSKIVTLSSTYDHRIIQGAESGMFLKKVYELLTGADDFYNDVFRSIGVPYAPAVSNRDGLSADGERTSKADKQARVNSLVHNHRVRGHLIANLDPLALKEPQLHSELDPFTYGLTIWDLDREFYLRSLTGSHAPKHSEPMPLREILGIMRDAYARTVGVEYMHIQDLDEKMWISERVEDADLDMDLSEKRHILAGLNRAEALELFLDAKYPGQKRFGIQGAESTIPLLDAVLGEAADRGLDSAIMGMAHRGRLNVLVNIVGKSYDQLFREFEGSVQRGAIQGSGDVKYHLGQSGTFQSRNGNVIKVDLAANPSHLEAVDPVVEGMVRARTDTLDHEPDEYPVLPLLIHGDAAFAGQGVVAETLNLSGIAGYRTGGTIHLVINNQVGFTTTPEVARSSTYPTDVARMVEAPIFHVNGDDPEACVRVARLAVAYREEFNKDVVIDLWCYRRQGHNEGDDPSYTQPLMYSRIEKQKTVREQYVERLVGRGDLTQEEADESTQYFQDTLQDALNSTRDDAPDEDIIAMEPPKPIGVLPHVHTSVSRSTIDKVWDAMTTIPDGFTIHPKLARQFERRAELFNSGMVDWGLAESLCFGSLLHEGISVRLSGQDSSRGTFAQRHSTLVDYTNGEKIVPLRSLASGDTNLWIYDSLLSEYAVLGFEYGYSVENPDTLTMWEAQFGDFVNGAQIIIDQFLVASEDKWNQNSGLVMLLPHGMEGQGPEHSSARMERFLLLAAEDNIQVANASEAAQYFHLLRRQMVREVRKPLVIFTPKSLLRARSAHSPIEALTHGTFEEVLDDPNVADRSTIRRIVFCTGKVSHEALQRRDETGNTQVAVVRVEQLYPWPYDAVAEAISHYPNVSELVWLQEEPENMGAWNAVKGRLYEAQGEKYIIKRVSRPESGSPATGSSRIHQQEQSALLDRAFAEVH